MDRNGARALPKRPPAAFLPAKWRKLIFANGAADRRLYEVAVLATLRERLRGSDIWVAGSRDYRAFEDYLLPAEVGRNLGIGDPAQFMKTRAAALHERLPTRCRTKLIPEALEKISRLFRFASDYQRGIANLTGVADGASASAWLSARISWSWLDKSQPRSHTWGVE
jgi:hypothetical protein